MSPELWHLAFELFHQCLEQPLNARAAFLEDAAKGHPELVLEVSSLLAAHDRVKTSFLEGPALADLPTHLVIDESAVEPGTRLGDFIIIRTLGSGAFATVYLAEQISLGRRVAVKVSRLLGEEARTMAKLEHPHIVQVHSVETLPERNETLICMQFVPGLSLESLIEQLAKTPSWNGTTLLSILDSAVTDDISLNTKAIEGRAALGRLSQEAVLLEISIALVKAIEFAHQCGVLHLDIKPANILLDLYGRPFLVDFNVSLDLSALRQKHTRLIGGTFDFMAPEQQRAFYEPEATRLIDNRSDIYALGRVVQSLAATCEPISPALHTLIGKCVADNREDRPSDATMVLASLESCRFLHSAEAAMPKPWLLLRAAKRMPGAMLYLVIFIPNLIASIVQVSYNRVNIVSQLTSPQKAVFNNLVNPWNVAIFTLASVVLLVRFWRLFAYLFGWRRPALSALCDYQQLRREAALLPPWGLMVITCGWAGGCLLFTLVFDRLAGPLPWAAEGHFFISFLLSWLIALTYALLSLRYLVLTVLYPDLLQGALNAKTEIGCLLNGGHYNLRTLRLLAGFVPLAGAALIVYQGPASYHGQDAISFQVLVLTLIATGMLGFVFAVKIHDETAKTLDSWRHA